MSNQSTLGGFAFACFLFGATTFGIVLAGPLWLPGFAALLSNPFFIVFAVFALQGLSGFLAILAIVFGLCSRKCTIGKLAFIGGFAVLIGNVGFHFLS